MTGIRSPPATDEDLPPSIHAAGAVLWRPAAAGAEVAVVHRPHHRDWSLPKGKVDPGESRARTAVREIAEETGFGAALGRHLATVRYPVGEDRKVVDYWEARAGEGTFTPNGETDELRWLAPERAAGLLSYDSDRDVLDAFARSPHPLCSLLLVRHAKAGKRGSLPDDDARPLVDAGRDQARRVADLLTAHGVARLVAASKVRCRETLEPASHRLGVGIADDPAFTDEAVADDPEPPAPACSSSPPGRRRRSAHRAAASRPWCATSPPTPPAGSGPRCTATGAWPTRRRARAASGRCPSTPPTARGCVSSRRTTCVIRRSEPRSAQETVRSRDGHGPAVRGPDSFG